jgi:hypothetical protein
MRRALVVASALVLLGGAAAAAEAPADPNQPPPSQPPPEQAPPSQSQPPSHSGQMVQGQFVPTKGSGLRIRGTAKLIRTQRGNTKLSVHAGGLPPAKAYPTRLHTGTCAEGGPDYKHDASGPAEPPNALWASSDPSDPKGGLQSSDSGNAKGYGVAPWLARPEARSVVIHSPDAGNPALACADLK